MTTLTISLAGSSITGLSSGPSQTVTVSDTDLQSLLNWAQSAFATQLSTAPTNTAIYLAWHQSWLNGTVTAVQRFQTQPPALPTPITFS